MKKDSLPKTIGLSSIKEKKPLDGIHSRNIIPIEWRGHMPIICVRLRNDKTNEMIYDEFLVQEADDYAIEACDIVSEEYGPEWSLEYIISTSQSKNSNYEDKNVCS